MRKQRFGYWDKFLRVLLHEGSLRIAALGISLKFSGLALPVQIWDFDSRAASLGNLDVLRTSIGLPAV